MNKGSPPTAAKARTGELTPPAMYCLASANRSIGLTFSSLLHSGRPDPRPRGGVARTPIVQPTHGWIPRMKTYMCLICGFIYDEAEGDPQSGIPPGTRWDDVPLSWRCPDCGAGKEDFDMVEV